MYDHIDLKVSDFAPDQQFSMKLTAHLPGEGKQAIWTKIGAAFPHGKGKGLTIQLDALPLGDSIVLREPKDDKAEAKA